MTVQQAWRKSGEKAGKLSGCYYPSGHRIDQHHCENISAPEFDQIGRIVWQDCRLVVWHCTLSRKWCLGTYQSDLAS